MRFLFFTLLLTASGLLSAQSRNLDIYWIDAEGGAASLIVSQSGESMLIDTGFAVGDRDAKRIYAVTQLAGLKKIDYVVISHFHADHVGGLPALSKMIPLGQLFGRSNAELEPANQQWLDNFNTAAAAKRTVVKAGDEIPLKGVRTEVVIADAKPIAKPVKGGGAPNPLCADAEQQGDQARAAVLLRESLVRGHELGYPWMSVWCLAGLGGVALAQGQAEYAARLLGATATLFEIFDPATSGLLAEQTVLVRPDGSTKLLGYSDYLLSAVVDSVNAVPPSSSVP
jgi:hypothetical protein